MKSFFGEATSEFELSSNECLPINFEWRAFGASSPPRVDGVSSESDVKRTWHAVSPGGEGDHVTFSVGLPVQEPSGEWSVVVSLGAIEPAPRKFFGQDGWQAVALGMRFIAARVTNFSERGWQFFWTEGGERASAEDLGLGPETQ